MKKCPKCGYNRFVMYSSIQKKQCGKCNTFVKWELKEGQNPTISNNRQVKRIQKEGSKTNLKLSSYCKYRTGGNYDRSYRVSKG